MTLLAGLVAVFGASAHAEDPGHGYTFTAVTDSCYHFEVEWVGSDPEPLALIADETTGGTETRFDLPGIGTTEYLPFGTYNFTLLWVGEGTWHVVDLLPDLDGTYAENPVNCVSEQPDPGLAIGDQSCSYNYANPMKPTVVVTITNNGTVPGWALATVGGITQGPSGSPLFPGASRSFDFLLDEGTYVVIGTIEYDDGRASTESSVTVEDCYTIAGTATCDDVSLLWTRYEDTNEINIMYAEPSGAFDDTTWFVYPSGGISFTGDDRYGTYTGALLDVSSDAFVIPGTEFTFELLKPEECEQGMLRVVSSPAVPSQVLVDGDVMDTWGLRWVKVPVGSHVVSFTDVQGFATPSPEMVFVSAGATTEVVGSFGIRGWLQVSTSPAVPATIAVDGVPMNDWGVWTDLEVGSYEVCFGDVADYITPACETVAVAAGATASVEGVFTPSAGAPGPVGHGYLRVTTDPAVPAQILVRGVARDTWGLNWLKLAPGFYEVSFTDVQGFTTPDPEWVSVAEAGTTELVGGYVERGGLQVVTSPALPATISVDGIPRNDWGMWTDLPVDTYEVCFGDVAGYLAPACESVTVTSGGLTSTTGTYTPDL